MFIPVPAYAGSHLDMYCTPMKQIGYIHLESFLVSDLMQTTPHRNINRPGLIRLGTVI